MKNLFAPRHLVVLLLCSTVLFSCTESFKRKFVLAQKLAVEFGTKSVKVGTKTSTDDKGTRSLTTLTFSGVNGKTWDDEGLEFASGLVAAKFRSELQPADLAGDTHIGITLEMTDGSDHEYEYPIKDLQTASTCLPVADQFFEKWSKNELAPLKSLLDPVYLPDSIMPVVQHLMAQTDSFYRDGKRVKEIRGIAFREIKETKTAVISLYFEEKSTAYKTRYIINVEPAGKKVTYLWTKTIGAGEEE